MEVLVAVGPLAFAVVEEMAEGATSAEKICVVITVNGLEVRTGVEAVGVVI